MRRPAPPSRAHRRPRRDAGFTLPELLVSISILGVVMVVLAGAVIGWLRYSDSTTKQLSVSHDVQLSAAYFARDVASMGTRDDGDDSGNPPLVASIQADAAYDEGGRVCGAAGTVAELRLLSDSWSTDADPLLTVEVVAYYFKAGPDGHELHRLKCDAEGSEDIVLARNVVPGSWDNTCAWTEVPPTGTPVPRTEHCSAAIAPDRVTLTFEVAAQQPTAGPAPNPITVTLTGQRRQT